MNEDVINELANRVVRALYSLSTLSEAPVRGEGFEATGPVSGGKGDGLPQRNDAEFDHHVGRLEIWCRQAEKRLREERKGQADVKGQIPGMTPEQKRYYLLHSGEYEGVEYRRAASKLNMTEQAVYQLRQRVGVDPRRGIRRAA